MTATEPEPGPGAAEQSAAEVERAAAEEARLRRRRRARRFRLYGWLVALTAALVAGGWIVWNTGPPTEAELRELAKLTNKQTLRIGVKDDTPGIALRDPQSGTYSGFDIDIALMIAEDLGFGKNQVEFLAIETEDRARKRARNKLGEFVDVDLVVATFSITREREEDPTIGFSSPYLLTEQSVVTKDDYDGEVTSLSQLNGKKVCTLGTSTSQRALENALPTALERTGAKVTGVNRIEQCMNGLLAGKYEAVSTDAAIMAGFVKEAGGRLRHHDVGLEASERWAVNSGTNTALRTLVDLALYRSLADPGNRRYEDAYDRHIRPLMPANQGIDIAGDRQPCPKVPKVRRWPWERDTSAQVC
ncbi:glutamate ABC transporter substrate-binding protein [Spongiactinospora gelatinilytica]|uniref:Glutamate ABC transporter substrate-binding protein n=1 Tax=Spongiactinospora gelatinilytica TaxID=2666298 RepID=A0A2W2G0P0_9ACTN|nr:glutamate ABC transporter substrate-binding protein [Spongiactinospora gelatinilytica]